MILLTCVDFESTVYEILILSIGTRFKTLHVEMKLHCLFNFKAFVSYKKLTRIPKDFFVFVVFFKELLNVGPTDTNCLDLLSLRLSWVAGREHDF